MNRKREKVYGQWLIKSVRCDDSIHFNIVIGPMMIMKINFKISNKIGNFTRFGSYSGF